VQLHLGVDEPTALVRDVAAVETPTTQAATELAFTATEEM
jgi:hypothetical protein